MKIETTNEQNILVNKTLVHKDIYHVSLETRKEFCVFSFYLIGWIRKLFYSSLKLFLYNDLKTFLVNKK